MEIVIVQWREMQPTLAKEFSLRRKIRGERQKISTRENQTKFDPKINTLTSSHLDSKNNSTGRHKNPKWAKMEAKKELKKNFQCLMSNKMRNSKILQKRLLKKKAMILADSSKTRRLTMSCLLCLKVVLLTQTVSVCDARCQKSKN